MDSPPNLFTLACFSRKELIVVFSLCTTLFISIVCKYTADYHWNAPDTEVIQPQSSQQLRFQLDINEAEWYELVLLPEVGEARSKAIVAHRKKHGKFQDISQLLNVKGINASVIKAIKDYVKVNND